MRNVFFDIAIPPEWLTETEETVLPTEEILPQTGEAATALGGADIQTILLLLVILLFAAVGIVYLFMIRKKRLALQNGGETSEANEE